MHPLFSSRQSESACVAGDWEVYNANTGDRTTCGIQRTNAISRTIKKVSLSYNNMNVSNNIVHITSKIMIANFMLCIFYHDKKTGKKEGRRNFQFQWCKLIKKHQNVHFKYVQVILNQLCLHMRTKQILKMYHSLIILCWEEKQILWNGCFKKKSLRK